MFTPNTSKCLPLNLNFKELRWMQLLQFEILYFTYHKRHTRSHHKGYIYVISRNRPAVFVANKTSPSIPIANTSNNYRQLVKSAYMDSLNAIS